MIINSSSFVCSLYLFSATNLVEHDFCVAVLEAFSLILFWSLKIKSQKKNMKFSWQRKPPSEAKLTFSHKASIYLFCQASKDSKIQLKINALLLYSNFHSAAWKLRTRNIVWRIKLLHFDIFLRSNLIFGCKHNFKRKLCL